MGLIYGLIAFGLVFLLLLFGIRKRAYRSSFGTLQGWLQAHIYLGILSAFAVLFHTGFRFNDKVAVAAFVVLSLVVLSGIFGAILYVTVPRMLTEIESNLTAPEISEQLNQLAKSMARVASGKSSPFQKIYHSLIQEATPGALAGWKLLITSVRDKKKQKAGSWAGLLGQVTKTEQDELRQLLVISRQHKELHLRLIFQQRYRNILDFWLYMHLPLSIGLIVLILAHLVAVFYYGHISFK